MTDRLVQPMAWKAAHAPGRILNPYGGLRRAMEGFLMGRWLGQILF